MRKSLVGWVFNPPFFRLPEMQHRRRVGFQPTAKPQGFDCKYFRQTESV
ncbi:MAG: hypothetical protein IKI11_04730 [Neisseriaceae bacterium]|nr:hypothetical protein [Neisseriaceae bacterium]MBR7001948.1 hypothetical protein [Neisseriaceae bacterium]